MKPQTPKQRNRAQTGRSGELLVANALNAAGFMPRREDPDIGYDLNVEVQSFQTTPSRRFLVQVKAKQHQPLRSDRSWSVNIPEQSRRRYLESGLPVFLFSIELSSNEIRWIDLRAALLSSTAPTVHLPEHNRWVVGDVIAFMQSLLQAEETLLARLSLAELAAIRSREIEKLDGRLMANVSFDGAVERVTFSAKEDVALTIELTAIAQGDREKLADSMRFGSTVTVRPGSIAVVGSPALARSEFKPTALTVGSERTEHFFSVSAGRRINQSEFQCAATFLSLGTFSRGKSGIEFLISERNSLLDIRIRWDSDGPKMAISFIPRLELWVGKRIADFPDLSSLIAMLHAFAEGRDIEVQWVRENRLEKLIRGSVDKNIDSEVRLFLAFFQQLQLLRTVCSTLNWPATWDSEYVEFRMSEIDQLSVLHAICAQNEIEVSFEAVDVDQTSIDFTNDEEVSDEHPILIVSPMAIQVAGKLVGTARVVLETINYHFVKDAAGRVVQIRAKDLGRAVAKLYNE